MNAGSGAPAVLRGRGAETPRICLCTLRGLYSYSAQSRPSTSMSIVEEGAQ